MEKKINKSKLDDVLNNGRDIYCVTSEDHVLEGIKNVTPIQHDSVKHPSHYCRGGIECRDAISAWQLNFNRGCAVKYIMRAGHKDPGKEIEDLKKAVCCLEHEINILEGKDAH